MNDVLKLVDQYIYPTNRLNVKVVTILQLEKITDNRHIINNQHLIHKMFAYIITPTAYAVSPISYSTVWVKDWDCVLERIWGFGVSVLSRDTSDM